MDDAPINVLASLETRVNGAFFLPDVRRSSRIIFQLVLLNSSAVIPVVDDRKGVSHSRSP